MFERLKNAITFAAQINDFGLSVGGRGGTGRRARLRI